MLLLYSHFSRNYLQFANFYRLVFRCKVLRPFVFYLFEVQSTELVSSSEQGESVDLVVIFNKGREETFAVFLQNRKSCVYIRYLFRDSTTKVNSREFCVFILHVKCAELQYC